MNLKIVADSTFNLDNKFIEENNITVVPLNVIINGESFRDDIDVSITDPTLPLNTSLIFVKLCTIFLIVFPLI